jgi:hypothetical protein
MNAKETNSKGENIIISMIGHSLPTCRIRDKTTIYVNIDIIMEDITNPPLYRKRRSV